MTEGVSRRAALAAGLSAALGPAARAQDADRVTIGETRITTAGGDVAGLFGRPTGAGPFPVVLVAGSGRGLDRGVNDACRGLAKEGFLAIAPVLFAQDPPDGTICQRLDAARAWAGGNGGAVERLGIVGFGAGGRVAWIYDAYSPALKAAVAWGGAMQGATSPARPMTALDAAARLHAPLLGLFGKDDGTPRRVLLDAEAKAKAAGKVAQIVQYVNAGRDFGMAGTPGYDAAATTDGWQRTLAWLRDHGV